MENFKNSIIALTNENNRGLITNQTKLLLAQNKALADCNATSVISAIVNLDNIGLDLSTTKQEAYLVPFKGTAQLQIGYKGFEKLAYASGNVKQIRVETIYKNDTIEETNGLFFKKEDLDNIFEDKKKEDIKGFIATIEFNDGVIFQEKASAQSMWDFAKEYSQSYNYKKEQSI
jgi:recombination protein RecT